MRHPLRVVLMALALVATPAFALCPPAAPAAAVSLSVEQRAYALLQTYAIVLEEATDLIQHPSFPVSAKRPLAEAERAATAAAEALHAALAAYLHTREPASVLALHQAVEAAEASVAHLQALTRSPL
jgi:hypothetical protein